MDNLDLMGLLLQNKVPGSPEEETPQAINPVAQMMYPQEPNPFSPMGLVSATKTVKKGTGSEPMSQSEYLQRQLQAMNTQGMEQQQAGVQDYEKKLAAAAGEGVNPWQAVASGISDFYGGTNKLDKLQAQQQAKQQMQLAMQDKLQGAKNDVSQNQRNLLKDQLDYEKARDKNAADEERTRLMFGLAKAKADKKGFTPGQEAADKKFGAEYQEWNQQGGYAGVEKQLNALESAKAALTEDPSLTGGAGGSTPDAIRAYTNPKALAIKEQVRQAVQASLRQTLGSAFTEAEGERVFNSSYNSKLPAEQNIEKLNATIGDLRKRATEKEAASKYFEANGTLVGQNAATNRKVAPGGGLTPDQEKRRQELLKKKGG